jgi:hypothetical protein
VSRRRSWLELRSSDRKPEVIQVAETSAIQTSGPPYLSVSDSAEILRQPSKRSPARQSVAVDTLLHMGVE